MTVPDCASVGRIRRPHGVRGDVVVEALTDEPEAMFASGRRVFRGTPDGALYLAPSTGAPVTMVVRACKPFKEDFIITFDVIGDRTEAEKWNGRHLLVPVEELSEPDEHEVFAHELIGMTLVDAESGTDIGPIIDTYELPQGLLLEFRAGKAIASVPFVEEFVREVDRDGRRIVVRLPDGLLE